MSSDISEENKSVSRSVSSESSQGNVIAVAKFNQFDEILFTFLLTFYKEQRLGPIFQLLELIITVLQCITVTFQRNDWPMSGQFYQIFEDVFRWLTFSISWNNITFMLVMTILFGAFAVGVIVVIIICVLINKKGTMQIPIIGNVLNIIVSLLTGIFYLPAVNVFFGSFNCIGKAGTSSFTIGIKCEGSEDLIILIFGMLLFVFYFCFTFMIRLFIYQLEAKKGGPFTLQTGVYPCIVQVLTTLLPIVGIILRSQQAAIAGIGIVISFLLTIYPIGLQPYFSPWGNTIWASAMSIMGITFIVGLLCSFLDTTQTWVSVFIWILFIILVIVIPLIISVLTYKRARSLWAMREDEEVPEIKSKKNPLIILSNTQQQQAYPTQSQTPQIASSVNKNPHVIQNRSVNVNEPTPNTNASQSLNIPVSNKFTPETQPLLYQQAIPDQLHFFAFGQDKNQAQVTHLKKAVELPRYKTVFQIQNAIKFLNKPKLRKKHECIVLAEQLTSTGQKKFGSESSMWSTIAIYHSSFSKNNIRLSDALRNVKQNLPNILERWMVFAMMHDMENKHTQGSGSNQLGVTFRIRFQKATKEHELSKAFLNQAYMYLSKENIDLDRTMSLLDKAILHERLSREIFEELMKQHPNSISILRGFGALLRDIYRDDETALQMFNEANSIESDMSVIGNDNDNDNRSERMSQRSKGVQSMQSKRDDGKSVSQSTHQKKKKKKKNSNKSSLTIDLSEDKSNLIPGFLELIILCMAIITVCLLISFIFAINTFSQSQQTVEAINDCTQIMVQAYDVFMFCKYFGLREDSTAGKLDLSEVTFIPSMDQIKNITQTTAVKMGQTLQDAYMLTVDSSIFANWEQEFINQTLGNYIPDSTGVSIIDIDWQQKGNMIDILTTIANIADDISSSYWDSNLDRFKNLLFYMRANIPVTVIEVSKQIGIEYCNSAQKKAIVSVIISIVLGVVALVVPLIVNIIQFVYTIRKLKRERYTVFFALAKAPKSEYLNLKKRLDDVEKDDEAETQSLHTETDTHHFDHDKSKEGINDDQTKDHLKKKDNLQNNDQQNAFIEDNFDEDQSNDENEGLDEQEDKVVNIEENINQSPQIGMGMNNMMGIGSNLMGSGSFTNNQNSMQQLQMQMIQFQMMQQQQIQQQQQSQLNSNNKKKGKSQNDQNDEREEGEENDSVEKEELLMKKIKNISSFIPMQFFVRAVIGFVLIMTLPLAFTIISVYASLAAVQLNTAIFITGYRTSLLGSCMLCAINLANTGFIFVPTNFVCTLSTNPMWNDLSHFTDNQKLLQELLSKTLQFLQQINIRLLYGTSSNEAKDVTGDSLIDGITSIRTIKSNSETQLVQYGDRECFEARDGDCDIPNRIYGTTKSFHGFEALFGLFTQSCYELISKEDPYTEVSISTRQIQTMGSLLIYDLKGGCAAYRIAMVDEQTQQMSMLQTTLIIMFIVAILSTLVGFGLLITTRTLLFNVAESSSKMKELDPENDSNERTGMGPAGWKDAYACDSIRIDKQHERVLLYLAGLCGSIDTSMNVNEQMATLMNSEEWMDSIDTQTILHHYNSIHMERTHQNQGIDGQHLGNQDGEGNVQKDVDMSAFMNKSQLKDLVKKQLAIASIVVRTTFSVLNDEEKLIQNYKIAQSHRKAHENQHATIIRKIQSAMLSLAYSSRTKDGYTLIPSTHAQSLIRLYASWLVDHVQKIDRELVTLLIGKAPESELERMVTNVPQELKMPRSYTKFLDSDNASLQDKTLFNRMIKVLKLKQHSTH